MNNVEALHTLDQRVMAVEALKAILPACIQAAAQEVGPEGFKAFFAGYKENVDELKLAA